MLERIQRMPVLCILCLIVSAAALAVSSVTYYVQENEHMATQAQFDQINARLTSLTATIQTVIANQAATIAKLKERVQAGGLSADQEAAILANLDTLANNLQQIANSAA